MSFGILRDLRNASSTNVVLVGGNVTTPMNCLCPDIGAVSGGLNEFETIPDTHASQVLDHARCHGAELSTLRPRRQDDRVFSDHFCDNRNSVSLSWTKPGQAFTRIKIVFPEANVVSGSPCSLRCRHECCPVLFTPKARLNSSRIGTFFYSTVRALELHCPLADVAHGSALCAPVALPDQEEDPRVMEEGSLP